MTQPRRVFRTGAVCAALLALALQPAAAAAAAKRTLGAETPQALVDRLNAGMAKEDLGEIVSCLAPDDRAELVFGLVAATGMIGAFLQMGGEMAGGIAEGMAEALAPQDQEAETTAAQKAEAGKAKREIAAKAEAWQKKYEATLKKHGLGDLFKEGADLPAGEGPEAARAMLKNTDEVALLEDLMALMKEAGDGKETGAPTPPGLPQKPITDLKVDGDRATARSGDETVELVKIDGRWYAEAPENEEPEAPEAPENGG